MGSDDLVWENSTAGWLADKSSEHSVAHADCICLDVLKLSAKFHLLLASIILLQFLNFD